MERMYEKHLKTMDGYGHHRKCQSRWRHVFVVITLLAQLINETQILFTCAALCYAYTVELTHLIYDTVNKCAYLCLCVFLFVPWNKANHCLHYSRLHTLNCFSSYSVARIVSVFCVSSTSGCTIYTIYTTRFRYAKHRREAPGGKVTAKTMEQSVLWSAWNHRQAKCVVPTHVDNNNVPATYIQTKKHDDHRKIHILLYANGNYLFGWGRFWCGPAAVRRVFFAIASFLFSRKQHSAAIRNAARAKYDIRDRAPAMRGTNNKWNALFCIVNCIRVRSVC